MNIDQAFFLYFAVMIVAFSIVTITRKNPVYAVMALLVVFFHVAGLYVLLNAEFIAALQVVVYAGAILVLYRIRDVDAFSALCLFLPWPERRFRV